LGVGYQNSETPEPIVTKFGMGDYVTDSNQILRNDKDPRNTFRGWSKQAYDKSKMTDGRHLEKSENGHISATV